MCMYIYTLYSTHCSTLPHIQTGAGRVLSRLPYPQAHPPHRAAGEEGSEGVPVNQLWGELLPLYDNDGDTLQLIL